MTAHTPFHYHHPETPPPRHEPVGFVPGDTVLFLGDSITAADPGYVSIIAQSLARTRADLHLRLLNAGREGDTSRTAVLRLAQDVLAHQPDWVVINLGLNDLNNVVAGNSAGVALPEFQEHYSRIVQTVRDAGCQVILMTTGVLGEDLKSKRNGFLKEYNSFIRTLAEREGLRLVDVNRAFLNAYDRAATYKQEVTLTTDGVHPNLQGYALIARTFIMELGLLHRPGAGA
jgi:lysophospholipase L1-like esterase